MIRDRKHIRLVDWDYSSAGTYFITICCKNKEDFFGKILEEKMVLSEIGIMALCFWQEIPLHFKHVKLESFIIMPNHIHGILLLDYSKVGTRHGVSLPTTCDNVVGPCHGMALQHQKNRNRFSRPVKNSISVIINQYKSALKRWCNKNGFKSFCWQSRFYEQILHNENAIYNVKQYISANPRNWNSVELFR